MKTTKNPTIYDVAKLAEVSEATVSYILRGRRGGKSRISEATRQKVLAATNTLGYAPNSAAINLSTRRTDRISLVLSQIGAPYHHAIARDVQQIAIEHNYTLSISISETPQQQDLIIEQLHQRFADGAIIVDPHPIDETKLEILANQGLSLVIFGSIPPKNYDVVSTQDVEACQAAVSDLKAKGHEKFALFGNKLVPNMQEHLINLQSTLLHQGIEAENIIINNDICSRLGAYNCTTELLQSPEHPTALIYSGSAEAIRGMWAVQKLGFTIPDDIAVVGRGNIPDAEMVIPTLTTIGYQDGLDFTQPVLMLFERLQGEYKGPGRQYNIPRQYIQRKST